MPDNLTMRETAGEERELRDLRAYGEPGAVVYLCDCLELMRLIPPRSVDAVFADPPYRLSNGGVTVKNGLRSRGAAQKRGMSRPAAVAW